MDVSQAKAPDASLPVTESSPFFPLNIQILNLTMTCKMGSLVAQKTLIMSTQLPIVNRMHCPRDLVQKK